MPLLVYRSIFVSLIRYFQKMSSNMRGYSFRSIRRQDVPGIRRQYSGVS